MAYFNWIPKPLLVAREDIMDLWQAWGIQMLVMGSTSFQAILLFGNRRRYVTGRRGILLRMILWVTYLFATEVVPYSLGKLTGLRISDPSQPDPNIELKAFLAPLLLLQLGYPDNITAYSMEDNRMGWRQVVSMIIVVAVVIGVLISCFSYSTFVFLYVPMFLAGIVKYAEGVWALKFALGWDIGITRKQEKVTPISLGDLPRGIEGLELLVKAYNRFRCLKPHLENWIYHPFDISDRELSIEHLPVEDAFKVTEMELGFMYDVLYTKAPIIYTKLGLIVRFVSFLLLFITLCAFRILARTLPQNVSAYTNFTFSVLMVTFLIEMYQILLLPYSDWAIVKMAKRHKWPFVLPLLRKLAPRSVRWRRWSNKQDQFNLLSYCLQDDWTRYIKFLKCCGIQEYIKRNWSLNRMGPVPIPPSQKEKLLQELRNFEAETASRPFSRRGDWTFRKFHVSDEDRWRVAVGFDQCIIQWHIATHLCYHRSRNSSNLQSGSKFISNYMVYLLAIHPYILSVITGDIVFANACTQIESLLKNDGSITTEDELTDKIWNHSRPSSSSTQDQSRILYNWDAISESCDLARWLWNREDRWELIDSFWMEMLFSAAQNCQLSHHADQLRRGGELITLVWLLFAHKTDKTHP